MIGRRRFVSILAGAGCSAGGLLGWSSGAVSFAPPYAKPYSWKGMALGASASLTLVHEDAARLVAQVRAEIGRLEAIFSLYSHESALSRLNADGSLRNPPFELLELLAICDGLHARTNGAFDPTIQPLWSLYAQKYAAGQVPSPRDIKNVLTHVGWKNVRFETDRIVLGSNATRLTLNGIAQGYITDKVARLLRSAGVSNVLINIGELVALGRDGDGNNWQVGIADPANSHRVIANKRLSDAAIATSAPLGTVFDPAGSIGHILDPRTGRPGNIWRQISVISPKAATADGLSTAFCLMEKPDILKASTGLQVEMLS